MSAISFDVTYALTRHELALVVSFLMFCLFVLNDCDEYKGAIHNLLHSLYCSLLIYRWLFIIIVGGKKCNIIQCSSCLMPLCQYSGFHFDDCSDGAK